MIGIAARILVGITIGVAVCVALMIALCVDLLATETRTSMRAARVRENAKRLPLRSMSEAHT